MYNILFNNKNVILLYISLKKRKNEINVGFIQDEIFFAVFYVQPPPYSIVIQKLNVY